MTDTLPVLPDAACKDAHPLDTVNRIKGILSGHGIQTEELWSPSNVPHCYSLRVNIAGTNIGANGKGVNEVFALASGYGELMERLQLGMIWRNKIQVEGGLSSCDAQSQKVSAAELLRRNSGWYAIFSEKLRQITGITMTGKEILDRYTDAEGFVRAAPFYCATSHTREYLPATLCRDVYGSNGSAAGNTLEEAIVQAISEIVERQYKLKIIYDHIPVPQIPEEELRHFPIVWEIIEFLQSHGLRVTIRDCSLGTKFPVVCVCIVDSKTGRYHTHFGAFPDFEIAMQRTLTESFQGRSLQNIAKFEDFSRRTDKTPVLLQFMTELRQGTAEQLPQFFYNLDPNPYRRTAGFTGTTNKERLAECIAFFREQGLDVLVRDSSCLGFPTCQVIIPGYSEVMPHRISPSYNDMGYVSHANRVLRDPVTARPDEIMGLLMHLAQCKKLRPNGAEGFLTEAGLQAVVTKHENKYLMSAAMAHIHYTLGKYADTVAHINKALQTGAAPDEGYLICVKRYLTMTLDGHDPEQIRRTLGFFHSPQTVETLYAALANKRNPLDSTVLRCDGQCRESCLLYSRCRQRMADRLVKLITTQSANMSQDALEELLKVL